MTNLPDNSHFPVSYARMSTGSAVALVLLPTGAWGVGRLIRDRRSFLNPVSPKRTWNCRVPSPFRGTKKWEKNNKLLETTQLHRVCAPVLLTSHPTPRQPSHRLCVRMRAPAGPRAAETDPTRTGDMRSDWMSCELGNGNGRAGPTQTYFAGRLRRASPSTSGDAARAPVRTHPSTGPQQIWDDTEMPPFRARRCKFWR
jgi:hypothetical protein